MTKKNHTKIAFTFASAEVSFLSRQFIKIIELFKENKQSDDTLAKWIDRVVSGNESSKITGVDDIKKAIAPLIVPPNVEDEPDFYMDYGSDTNYHTVTGKGECAA